MATLITADPLQTEPVISSPTAANTPVPTLTMTPEPEPARYGEPAGCQDVSPSGDLGERFLYAEKLLGEPHGVRRRIKAQFWNPQNGKSAPAGEILSLDVQDLQWKYQLQELANAVFIAGFIPRLYKPTEGSLEMLLIPLDTGRADDTWQPYIQSYFDTDLPGLAGDEMAIPMLRLTPCRWMAAQGLAPDLEPGVQEEADWSQPDLLEAGRSFLAADTDAAFAVAKRIHWLEGDGVESPANMCGPLAWAILAEAGALPPGYGGWSKGPISFWLPDPKVDGRPWSLFPEWLYSLRYVYTPLAFEDFNADPLNPGDILYTNATRFGFDHVLLVSDTDEEGNAWSFTNIIHNKPVMDYTIRHVMLYSLRSEEEGIIRGDWSHDRRNGLTGQGGFEQFTWLWREKDIRQTAMDYIVRAGDSLPLVAMLWKTPPEEIARANGMQLSDQLEVGQTLSIPPNPLP